MKKKRKRRSKSGKGSSFEREICKKLSLWWTLNRRDDVFWRTSGSGARAKTRSKTKQKTFGQYGDVQATDPIGQPLIDACTIELKRGYNNATLSDFVDRIGKKEESKPQLQAFMEQAATDCANRNDGSEWILLVKRDYKEVVLFTPYKFFKKLKGPHSVSDEGTFLLRSRIFGSRKTVFICKFEWFLEWIEPKWFQGHIFNERRK